MEAASKASKAPHFTRVKHFLIKPVLARRKTLRHFKDPPSPPRVDSLHRPRGDKHDENTSRNDLSKASDINSANLNPFAAGDFSKNVLEKDRQIVFLFLVIFSIEESHEKQMMRKENTDSTDFQRKMYID